MKMNLKMMLTAGALLAGVVGEAKTVALEPFKDGDTVVFFGDSITCGGYYHQYLSDYYHTRFPEAKIRLVNSGVSGDNAGGAQKRIADDVTYYSPTWVLIHFGMNDVGRGDHVRNQSPAQKAHAAECRACFERNLVVLSDKVRDAVPGVREIYATPTPYDDTAVITNKGWKGSNWEGCNKALAGLGEYVEKTAEARGVPSVNWHKPLNDFLQKRRDAGDMQFMFTGLDRVHPKPAGHAIMAWTFLKAQGVPATVSDIVVDAEKAKAVKSENATVTEVKSDKDGLSCTVLAKSLPFPAPAEARDILDEFDVENTLNREVFAVTGLAQGEYALLIDGEEVARADAAQLAKGLHLGFNEKTPQYRQAAKFCAENESASKLERTLRMRGNRSATERENLLILQEKSQKQVKPVAHTYVVRRVAQ
jgi:lysophospholipase L1-like esterase